jgi:hypothetical protein
MVYPALLPLVRTPRLPVVKWTDAPADLNGLVRFAERRNLVCARVPSHFKRSLLTFLSKEFHKHGTDRQYCKFYSAVKMLHIQHNNYHCHCSSWNQWKYLKNNKNNKKNCCFLRKVLPKGRNSKQHNEKKGLQNSRHVTYSTGEPASGNSVELFMKIQQLFSYLRNCLPVGSTLTQ